MSTMTILIVAIVLLGIYSIVVTMGLYQVATALKILLARLKVAYKDIQIQTLDELFTKVLAKEVDKEGVDELQ